MIKLSEHGYGTDNVYDLILEDVRSDPLMRFDWFLKSRSSLEIQRRCATIVGIAQKEYFNDDEKRGRGRRK